MNYSAVALVAGQSKFDRKTKFFSSLPQVFIHSLRAETVFTVSLLYMECNLEYKIFVCLLQINSKTSLNTHLRFPVQLFFFESLQDHYDEVLYNTHCFLKPESKSELY